MQQAAPANAPKSASRPEKPSAAARKSGKRHDVHELSVARKEMSSKKTGSTARKRFEAGGGSSATSPPANKGLPNEPTERTGAGNQEGVRDAPDGVHQGRLTSKVAQDAQRPASPSQNHDGVSAVVPAVSQEVGSPSSPQQGSGFVAGCSAWHAISADDHPAAMVPPDGPTGLVLVPNSTSNNVRPDAATTTSPASERGKSGAAVFVGESCPLQVLSGEELSGKEADAVVASILPATAAPKAKPTRDDRKRQDSVVRSPTTFGGSRSFASERDAEFTARSAYERSLMRRQHGAVAERAWMDRRPSQVHQHRFTKSCVATLTAACACSLVLLLLTFYAAYKRHVHHPCMSPFCVAFAKGLQASINASVQPCENFGRFVCDGWSTRHELAVRELAFVEALGIIAESLQSFAKPEKQDHQDGKQKAAMLYRSCELVWRGERDELHAVRDALRSEGIVWPHKSPTPDVLRTVLRSSLVLRWGAPFDVIVRSSARLTVVQMEVSNMFSCLHDKFVEAFGGNQERDVYFETLKSAFMVRDEDVFDFDTVNDFDTAAFLRLPQKVQRSRYPVALRDELIFSDLPYVTEQDWWEALGRFVTPNKTSRLVVSTRSKTYVQAVWRLWEVIGEHGMHTFLSWSVVQIAALYANRQLLLNFYGNDATLQLVQGASCLANAFLIAGDKIFSGYTNVVFAAKAHLQAHSLIGAVSNAFLLRLNQWIHFEPNVVVLTQPMTAETPLPIVHGDTVKESDDHVDEMSDSLVRNIRNVPVLDPESRDLRSKAFRAIEAAKFFVLLKSDFALMPYVFTFPFFHGSATTVLNYAGVGFVAAYALAKLFLRAYGASASASETMQKGLHCMMNRSAYGLTGDVEDDVVMLRVLAAKISLDAYEHEIERESSREVPVNGLEAYTGLQLFFLASCYALCPGSAERADPGAQCNAHLQQMEEFARAFDCAPGTPMNPQPKCSTM